MGQEEILEKLDKELKKDIYEECQVVYILSRIRKYLELKNLKKKYKVLNFYCNWALHSKLERTEPVIDMLKELSTSDDPRLLKFDGLPQELKKFLEDQELPTKIIDDLNNYLRFVNLLVDIYADTPLEFYAEEKRMLTIKKPKKVIEDSVFSIEYALS